MKKQYTRLHLFNRTALIYVISVLVGSIIWAVLFFQNADSINETLEGFFMLIFFSCVPSIPAFIALFLLLLVIYSFRPPLSKARRMVCIIVGTFLISLAPILIFILLFGFSFLFGLKEDNIGYVLWAPYSFVSVITSYFVNTFWDKKMGLKTESFEEEEVLDDIFMNKQK